VLAVRDFTLAGTAADGSGRADAQGGTQVGPFPRQAGAATPTAGSLAAARLLLIQPIKGLPEHASPAPSAPDKTLAGAACMLAR